MTEQHDPFNGLVITWKDGLPKDRAEESVIKSTLISARLTSRHSALKRILDGDTAAVAEEERRIEEENAQATLGATVTAQGQTPPADRLGMSAKFVAQLRGEPQRAEGK